MIIELKVYFQNAVSVVKANKHMPMNLFKKKCIKDLNLKYDDEDIRLRFYDNETDMYLECFTNKENYSLDQLNIMPNTYLAIETKTADEEFLPVVPFSINLKVCV
jgi:hypothetical protein